jgi:transcription elongation factor Elf1
MPNTNAPLPIQCPECQHRGSTLVVKSLTVLTVTCASCRHTWATALEWLPEEIQEKVRIAAADT